MNLKYLHQQHDGRLQNCADLCHSCHSNNSCTTTLHTAALQHHSHWKSFQLKVCLDAITMYVVYCRLSAIHITPSATPYNLQLLIPAFSIKTAKRENSVWQKFQMIVQVNGRDLHMSQSADYCMQLYLVQCSPMR